MTLKAYLIIISIIYLVVIAKYVRELAIYTTKKERRENATCLTIFAYTFLFASLITFGFRYFPH